MKDKIFLFDVESTSLHGVGFAVGAVVGDYHGNILDKFSLKSIEGEKEANGWVKENVLPSLTDMSVCKTNWELRNRFYEFYKKWKDECDIWGDVIYPVESNFLSAIVKDSPTEREWEMPYPIKDLVQFVSVDVDRSNFCPVQGLRKHHPLDDSMASYYCLIDFYKRLKSRPEIRRADAYDSTTDTLLHIKRVNQLLIEAAQELLRRATVHDNSKLQSPEKELFDEMTPKLKGSTYGSQEYKGFLKQLKVALDHHYSKNSHHPEYYNMEVNGMDLFDLIEMFIDWKAAGERHQDGNIYKSIHINKERFKMSDQLVDIFNNTADRLGYKRPETLVFS